MKGHVQDLEKSKKRFIKPKVRHRLASHFASAIFKQPGAIRKHRQIPNEESQADEVIPAKVWPMAAVKMRLTFGSSEAVSSRLEPAQGKLQPALTSCATFAALHVDCAVTLALNLPQTNQTRPKVESLVVGEGLLTQDRQVLQWPKSLENSPRSVCNLAKRRDADVATVKPHSYSLRGWSLDESEREDPGSTRGRVRGTAAAAPEPGPPDGHWQGVAIAWRAATGDPPSPHEQPQTGLTGESQHALCNNYSLCFFVWARLCNTFTVWQAVGTYVVQSTPHCSALPPHGELCTHTPVTTLDPPEAQRNHLTASSAPTLQSLPWYSDRSLIGSAQPPHGELCTHTPFTSLDPPEAQRYHLTLSSAPTLQSLLWYSDRSLMLSDAKINMTYDPPEAQRYHLTGSSAHTLQSLPWYSDRSLIGTALPPHGELCTHTPVTTLVLRSFPDVIRVKNKHYVGSSRGTVLRPHDETFVSAVCG
ncbi:hypothetical protein J6590_060443 [Homalodisca vitripennis]|nr:hypothetical protein J6590_060443 [Homalodisca vitripennis]